MRGSFTDESRRDLRSMAVFIAADSADRAARFVIDLEAACLGVAGHPRRYALIPEFERQAYRRRPPGNYRIIHIVGEDIQTTGILHAALDLSAALGAD